MGAESELERIAADIAAAFRTGPEEGTRAWTELYGDRVLVSHAHETAATDGYLDGDDLRALHRAEMKGWMKVADFEVTVSTKVLAHGVGVEVAMSGTLPDNEKMHTQVWNRLTIDDGRIVGMENVHLQKCEQVLQLGYFDEMMDIARQRGVGVPAAVAE